MKIQNKIWFTLVEIIVAITIFTVVMVSVISIYIYWVQVSYKAELNRNLHENVKSVISTIWEDIMKNWKNGISWVSSDSTSCLQATPGVPELWIKLCTGTGSSATKYYLAELVDNTSSPYTYSLVEKSNVISKCGGIKQQCYIVQSTWWDVFPITNNMISVKNLTFHATNDGVKKVTISMEIGPSVKMWVSSQMLEKTRMVTQFTVSERPTNIQN